MIILKRIPIIVLSSIFLLVGCQEDSNSVESVKEKNILVQNESATHSNELNLEELTQISNTIIVGTILDEELFSSTNTYKYSVLVDNLLKGSTESNIINVYAKPEHLELEHQYTLFLTSWEDELYPHTVYNLTDYSSIIEVQENKLIGDKKLIGNKNTNKLISSIAEFKQSAKAINTTESKFIDHAGSLEELFELSTNVLHVIPNEINIENLYIKNFNVTVVDVLKGDIDFEKMPLSLPSTVEAGKEYIVFLQESPEHRLATREDSVISKEDEKTWHAILEYIGK